MNPMLMAELAAKSFLVAGAALVLLALVRNRSAAERSWVAHASLFVLLALPAAALLMPRWRLLGPRQGPAADAGSAALAAAAPAADLAIWLQALYVVGAGVLVVGTLVAVARLFALRRAAAIVVDAHWLTALARAQARMGVKSGAALLVSPAVTSPVSWGLLRPTIVLSEAVADSRADAEAVIAHELAHLVRMDWAKLLIARVAVALLWFNPLVWVLARQCHQLREEAADDAVLCGEVGSAAYATLLVEAARHQRHGALGAAHGVAPGKGSLHRRVTRVLDAAARRTPTRRSWALGWLVAATVVAGPLAAATLERAKAPVVLRQTATVTTAGQAAKPLHKVTVTTAAAPRRDTVTVRRLTATKIAATPTAATSIRSLTTTKTAPAAPAAASVHGLTKAKTAVRAPAATSTQAPTKAKAAAIPLTLTVHKVAEQPAADGLVEGEVKTAPAAGVPYGRAVTFSGKSIVIRSGNGEGALTIESDTVTTGRPERPDGEFQGAPASAAAP